MDPNKVKVFSPTLIEDEDDWNRLKEFLERVAVEIKKDVFFDFTIFDDGSKQEWREKYSQMENKYSWLKIIYNEENLGVAKTILKAYQYFIGKCDDETIVVKIDSDNEHDPSKIKELVEKIEDGAICQILYKEEHQGRLDRLFNQFQGIMQGNMIFGEGVELKHNSPGFTAYRCEVLKKTINRYKKYLKRYEKEFQKKCVWGGDMTMIFIAHSMGFDINLETFQNSTEKAPNRSHEKILEQLIINTHHLELMNMIKEE